MPSYKGKQYVFVLVAHYKGQMSVQVYDTIQAARFDANAYNGDCTNPADRISLDAVPNDDMLHLNAIVRCEVLGQA